MRIAHVVRASVDDNSPVAGFVLPDLEGLTMSNEVTRLPVPERLEPKNAQRSLMQSVRGYFYSLYNSTDPTFREFLVSVGNEDAITGRRDFDRHEAVRMIKEQAKHAKDTITLQAKDGEIYRCLVNIMKNHDELRLKLRRIQYRQQAAE